MDKYNVYQDMSRRTGGEIYLGIVGPGAYRQIRTFIKRFMELVVIPEMADDNEKVRTIDERHSRQTEKRL